MPPEMTTMQIDGYTVLGVDDGDKIAHAVDMVNAGEVDGLNFTFTKNLPLTLGEIRRAHRLKYIQINHAADHSAVENLSTLESLSLYTGDRSSLDFSHLHQLKKVAIFWRPKAASLFACYGLESLFLGKYRAPDLRGLQGLTSLRALRLNTGSVRSLTGIERLTQLTSLQLMQVRGLEDLAGVELLQNLRHLTIVNCKDIRNIERLGRLTNLETLRLGGRTPEGS